ncbi:hypothetical protein COCCADRAFT_108482, partial [Bipolaris zeicola 26-R-13]
KHFSPGPNVCETLPHLSSINYILAKVKCYFVSSRIRYRNHPTWCRTNFTPCCCIRVAHVLAAPSFDVGQGGQRSSYYLD